MAAPLSPSAGNLVAVHLLDSAQGNPLQTWRFSGQDVITIGRDEQSDIVIADPQVSRSHTKLVHQDGNWMLVSLGRHGTLVNDRIISDCILQHQMVFRLGAGGPMLQFDAKASEARLSATIENIDADMFAMMAVDETRKQQEVDQIAGNSLFRELQEESRRMRIASGKPPKSS